MVFLLYLYIFIYNCNCKLDIIQPMAAMLLVNRTIYLVSMTCCKATHMSLAPSVGAKDILLCNVISSILGHTWVTFFLSQTLMLQLVQKYLSAKMIRQLEGLCCIPASNDNLGLLASCVNPLGVS